MQYELLPYLRCPVTKTELRFEFISGCEKAYHDTVVTEVHEGLLYSETGFVFPVIDGIPRMLVEAVYDYADFLKNHLRDYQKLLSTVEAKYKPLLDYCRSKNKKTKESFAFEWSFLQAQERDRIWHEDISDLSNIFLKETSEEPESLSGKLIIDVGCGHGIMTSKIGEAAKLSIGVEISKAVESAYQNNRCAKAWYVQGDLQFLPFADHSFDLLYCSGVIHHTNNTELSFLLIEPFIKNDGKICLWLYHPQKSLIHNTLLGLRAITKRLPLKIAYFTLAIFVFPLTYLLKTFTRRKAPNYREEMIDLLDQFTPEFRSEIPQDLAKSWLIRKQYKNVCITTENQFGYSVTGEKKNHEQDILNP